MIVDNKLLIAVISDIHCKHSSNDKNTDGTYKEKNTILYSDIPRYPISRNPVSALFALIQAENLKADVILCPGDIADKADAQGLITGWSYLEEIRTAMSKDTSETTLLAATIGNHDVDSRSNSDSAFDFLKNLKSNYPVDDIEEQKNFWSDGFCIISKNEYLILIYNSSAYHTDKEKAKKSLIKDITLEKMEQRLSKIGEMKYKIAMCHHHPNKHANKDYVDDDVMDKGDSFIHLLEKHNFQILIHGHKHDPKLNYFNTLPVLCAASFSSLMNLKDINAENMFHIIEIEGESKRGIIRSWVHRQSAGWKTINDVSFPCFTGFGYRNDINTLADDCANWFLKTKKDLDYYSNLLAAFPDINYLIPTYQEKLQKHLLEKHHIELSPALPNKPKTIAKQVQ